MDGAPSSSRDARFRADPSEFYRRHNRDETLERARALLDQLPGKLRAPMEERLDALAKDLSGASLTDRRERFLAGLGKGSLVYLPRYRQRVIVHKLDRAKREVHCKLGSMKIKVAYDEVTPYESL